MHNRNMTFRSSINFLLSFFILITLIGLLVYYNIKYSASDSINSNYIIILTASIIIGINLYFFIKSSIDFYSNSFSKNLQQNTLDEYEIEQRVRNRVSFIKSKYSDLENEIEAQIEKMKHNVAEQLRDKEISIADKDFLDFKKKEILNIELKLIELNRQKIEEIQRLQFESIK